METRIYRIEGMSCASCVRRVQKALASVPGVQDVAVNLATEEATLRGEHLDEASLAKTLEERGYRLVEQVRKDQEDSVSRRALVRVILAWTLTLPLLAGMIPGLHLKLPWGVQAALSAGAAFGAGWPFFARAARQALKLETSMDTLIALGAGLSWLFGMHEGFHRSPHPPFETAAALVSFLSLGKYLEARAKHRATDAVESLLKLAPSMALRLNENGQEEEIPTSLLKKGDVVRVKPGGAIPVDGMVISGQADVEEALLSGEPMPVSKREGDPVIAGAMVHGGALVLRVEFAGRDTWLARLARQVAEAQGSRAPVQDLADRLSAYFVPSVLVLAVLTLGFWWWQTGSLLLAWRPAITVLIIACPCALGLATPVAMAASLGCAARNGLLVRDATAMERLSRITDLVFDKTGTLTRGHPTVREILTLETAVSTDLLRVAAALERNSEHPFAKAIRTAAKDLQIPEVETFQSHPGGGISGVVNGRAYRLGNPAWLGYPMPVVPAASSAVGLADDLMLLGVFVLTDELRPESREVAELLQSEGLRLHLLSGDRNEVVNSLAARLGIQNAEGQCSPTRKLERVRDLQAAGAVVAFVGDGVNDAPALAQADAGISLPGLEATQASAPLNLLREGLDPLLKVRSLSCRTRKVVAQNLAWAFGYNLLLVPLAAFNLLDKVGGPLLAGAAMGLSSLSVVLNALRLRKI